MNKYPLFIAFLSILALASCRNDDKTIETNSRGVPLSIAALIMGDSYEIDTLYKADASSVIFIDNPDYTQHIIYSGEQVLVNLPTLRVDSIAPDTYEVQDMLRGVRVDFASDRALERLNSAFPQYPDFVTVLVDDTTLVGQRATFAYAVSRPTDRVSHSREILRWVEHCIDDTLAFNSNVKLFGQQIERNFFDEWPKPESDFQYLSSRSMLVYEVSPKYVTYNDFFYAFLGGAHGISCNRYVSFWLADGKPVTADSFFKPDCEAELRELIYEAIASDSDFMSAHKITSMSQVRSYIQRNLDGDPLPIPDPGLLREGVVFCYQPYEIAPYSDGTFLLVIPYDKIMPYIANW